MVGSNGPSSPEKEYPTHVSVLVINPDGKMPLALQRANDHWSFPKGPIKEDEEASAAMYSKFTEETGIAPTRLLAVRKLGMYARYSVGRETTHDVEYYCGETLARGGLRPSGRDIVTARWFTPREAADELQNPTDILLLEENTDYLLSRANVMRGE